MDTVHNRSSVLAGFLRGAIAVIKRGLQEFVDQSEYDDAIGHIEGVADELEAHARIARPSEPADAAAPFCAPLEEEPS